MTVTAKSSIALSQADMRLVLQLKERLGVKSNVAVIRQGLRLLQEKHDREFLKHAYRDASARVRKSTLHMLQELDGVLSDGIPEGW